MPTTSRTLSPTEEHALALDGLSWREGGLMWPHSAPPLRKARAELIADLVPSWALCAGHTAGWIWTGMGRAEPFDLLHPRTPAISPIARTTWKPRLWRGDPATIIQLGPCRLLSARETARDLLTRPGDDQAIVAQLYVLCEPDRSRTTRLRDVNPRGVVQRERMTRRLALLARWQRDYPACTR